MRTLAILFVMTGWVGHAAASANGLDEDGDYIDDGAELDIAGMWFPEMNMHCNSYEGTPHGSQGQFYGTDIGYATNGQLPFTAHLYQDDMISPCGEFGRCLELRYGMAYNWDLGDDLGGGGHRGDSEIVSLLLRTDESFERAAVDSDVWYVYKVYRSAHACSDEESSSIETTNNWYVPQIWVAEGKNGNYRTQEECNDGGWDGIGSPADDCGDNRCWINRDHAISKLQNVGEFGDPSAGNFSNFIPRSSFNDGFMGAAGANLIRYPGETPTTSPSGDYDVWGYGGFGGAGAYCKHLSRFVDWALESSSCEPHPSCP